MKCTTRACVVARFWAVFIFKYTGYRERTLVRQLGNLERIFLDRTHYQRVLIIRSVISSRLGHTWFQIVENVLSTELLIIISQRHYLNLFVGTQLHRWNGRLNWLQIVLRFVFSAFLMARLLENADGGTNGNDDLSTICTIYIKRRISEEILQKHNFHIALQFITSKKVVLVLSVTSTTLNSLLSMEGVFQRSVEFSQKSYDKYSSKATPFSSDMRAFPD